MNRRTATTAALGAAVAGAALAGTALAHGGAVSARREPLAVPPWLFLLTGGAVVGASFLLASTVTDRSLVRAVDGWRRPLGGRRLLEAVGTVGPAVGLLAVAGVVVAGALGPADPARNPAVAVVWVGWWAGHVATAYLLGDTWSLLNPFRAVADRLPVPGAVRERARGLGRSWGAWGVRGTWDAWGAWPAVVALLGLVYVEVVAPVSSNPRALAALVGTYAVLTVAGGALLGPAWFRSVDPVAKVFRHYGRVAPLAVGPDPSDPIPGTVESGRDPDAGRDPGAGRAEEGADRPAATDGGDAGDGVGGGEGRATGGGGSHTSRGGDGDDEGGGVTGGLALRVPGAGLTEPGGVDGPDEVAFVVAVVWVTTYDGLVTTPAWADLARAVVGALAGPLGAGTAASLTYGLALAGGFAVVLGAYRGAARLAVRVTDTYLTPATLARRFAPSLLAIAAGYHLAHFGGYFVSLSPVLAGSLLAAAPVGPAASAATPEPFVLPAWFGGLELGAVLGGHLLAVWVAHAAAFDAFPGRLQAVRSQYPFVAVMVAYTMASLWVVAQPSVASPFVG